MDSGFHFWLMELGFWIQIVNRIPDPTSKFFPDSGLHKKKFPVFRNADPFTWEKMLWASSSNVIVYFFCSIISVYVVVNFLSQVIILFLSFQLY